VFIKTLSLLKLKERDMKKVNFALNFVAGAAAIKDTDVKAKGEANDCFVRAVMNACQVSYDEAHAIAANEFGRLPRKGTKGTHLKLKTMQLGGAKLAGREIQCLGIFSATPQTPAQAKEKNILLNRKYPKGGGTYSGFTVGKFRDQHSKGSFIILVKGHALAIRDGKIYDNTDQLDTLFLTKGRDQRKALAIYRVK
jgi:hypothetical protein